jgi:hypothetical protein
MPEIDFPVGFSGVHAHQSIGYFIYYNSRWVPDAKTQVFDQTHGISFFFIS